MFFNASTHPPPPGMLLGCDPERSTQFAGDTGFGPVIPVKFMVSKERVLEALRMMYISLHSRRWSANPAWRKDAHAPLLLFHTSAHLRLVHRPLEKRTFSARFDLCAAPGSPMRMLVCCYTRLHSPFSDRLQSQARYNFEHGGSTQPTLSWLGVHVSQ